MKRAWIAVVAAGAWASSARAAAEPSVAAPPAKAATERRDADARLLALLEEDLRAAWKAEPVWASTRGKREFDRRLPDESPAAHASRVEDARARLAALDAIDAGALSPDHRLNAALLRFELRLAIEESRFDTWQMPVTQQSNPVLELVQLPDRLPLRSGREAEDYLQRLEGIPAYLEQVQANMKAGLAAGRTPPRVVLAGVAEQVLSQSRAEDGGHMLLSGMGPGSAADEEQRARGAALVRDKIAPAIRAFGEFLRDEYVPGCRETIGASALPDGAAFYALQIRRHTTLALSADEIHAIGLREVARIRAEMLGVIARTDFAGRDEPDAEKRFAAFIAHLRTDPRFYFTKAEDLLAAYREIAKRVDGEMPRFFRRLPRLPYGVREMPRFMAPTAPTAYYYPGSLENGQAGFFVANTFALDQRPKYEMTALTLHEAVPGHHHQVALAQEAEGVPEWRRERGYTIFVEGWALYAERLGLEMDQSAPGLKPGLGLYTDPYDDFGRLSYEMWRAMRLVVDTGLHAKGWTRDQAIGFMAANSALTKTNIEREVDRYIAWPGQALAYKLGQMKILELRKKAEAELGPRFDLRDFHDMLLERGAVPLEALEQRTGAWIEDRRAAAR
ncbi:MAG: DUF885 domain-containing protein [Phycisphaerales bacterium]|nr:DUF885 domain-containing protein [Phycisphaerales bacterium]